jgi:hypothetical protein
MRREFRSMSFCCVLLHNSTISPFLYSQDHRAQRLFLPYSSNLPRLRVSDPTSLWYFNYLFHNITYFIMFHPSYWWCKGGKIVLLCWSAFADVTGQCHNNQLSLTLCALRACLMALAKVQREWGVSFGFKLDNTDFSYTSWDISWTSYLVAFWKHLFWTTLEQLLSIGLVTDWLAWLIFGTTHNWTLLLFMLKYTYLRVSDFKPC